jgi:hypothetical protein
MKFNSMISQGKAFLRGAVKGMAAVAETGVLEGVPIVSNILSGAQLINDTLEGKEEADDSLAEVKATVELVSPIVVKIAGATDKVGDAGLTNNLKAVSDVLEELWEHVDTYVKKGDFIKVSDGTGRKCWLALPFLLKKKLTPPPPLCSTPPQDQTQVPSQRTSTR